MALTPCGSVGGAIDPQSRGLLVLFPVGARAWVTGSVLTGAHVGSNQLMVLSLSISLPLRLKINKCNLSKRRVM